MGVTWEDDVEGRAAAIARELGLPEPAPPRRRDGKRKTREWLLGYVDGVLDTLERVRRRRPPWGPGPP